MASLQSPLMQVDMAAATRQQRFLQAPHYVAPALVLGYFLITTVISACTLQNLKPGSTGSRKLLVPLVCLVTISFLVESCMLLTDTATTAVNDARHSSTDSNVSIFPREPRRQSSHTLVTDHKLIRFTHSSHCSSGQALPSALSDPRIPLYGTRIQAPVSLDSSPKQSFSPLPSPGASHQAHSAMFKS